MAREDNHVVEPLRHDTKLSWVLYIRGWVSGRFMSTFRHNGTSVPEKLYQNHTIMWSRHLVAVMDVWEQFHNHAILLKPPRHWYSLIWYRVCSLKMSPLSISGYICVLGNHDKCWLPQITLICHLHEDFNSLTKVKRIDSSKLGLLIAHEKFL